jgi:hypothetical protein
VSYKYVVVSLTACSLDYVMAQEPADAQMSFASEHHPSVSFTIPFLEFLQTRWETLLDDPEFEPVHHGIQAGLENLNKWYRKLDDTDVYFVCLGLSILSLSMYIC